MKKSKNHKDLTLINDTSLDQSHADQDTTLTLNNKSLSSQKQGDLINQPETTKNSNLTPLVPFEESLNNISAIKNADVSNQNIEDNSFTQDNMTLLKNMHNRHSSQHINM